MPDIKQSLRDYVATANSGKYKTEEELNSKFPELKGYDINSLKDYVATSNSGKYGDENELNSKFPELFSEPVKKKVPTPDLSGAVAGAGSGIQNTSPLESTSVSGIGEISEENINDLTYANVPDITKGVFKGVLPEQTPVSEIPPDEFPLDLSLQKQQPSTLDIAPSTIQQNILAQQHGAIAPVESFLNMPIEEKLITFDQNRDLQPTLLKHMSNEEKTKLIERKQQQAAELIPTAQSNFINPILKLAVEPIEFQASVQMIMNNTLSDNPEVLKQPKSLYDFTQKTKGLIDDVFKSNEELYKGTSMEEMPEKMQAIGSIVPYLIPIGAPAKIIGGIATKAVIEGLPKLMIDASVMGMSGFNQGFTAAKDKIEEINKYPTAQEYQEKTGGNLNDWKEFYGNDPIVQGLKAGIGTGSSASMMAAPLFLQWFRGAKIGGNPFVKAIDKMVSDVKGAETLLNKASAIYENSGRLITPLIKSGGEFAGIGAGMTAISSFTAQQLYNSSTNILEDVADGLSDSFAMGVVLAMFHPVLVQKQKSKDIVESTQSRITLDNLTKRAEQIDAQKTSETAPEPRQQSPEVQNLESQKDRLVESLSIATNETVKEATINKLESLDKQIEDTKIKDSETQSTQELNKQTIIELEKKNTELETAKSEAPDEVKPEIEKQQEEIATAIEDLRGKKITPQPEVKTDIETVKKELELTPLESELYDTFKDVKPEEYEDLYTDKLRELINKSDERTDNLEKQLDEIDTKRDDIDRKIDEIKENEVVNEKDYRPYIKKKIKQLEKEYKGLDKTEKQLKKDIAAESKHNEELFALPDDGSGIQDIVNKVNSRLKTRQQVNSGSDLFPETANIKELKLNKSDNLKEGNEIKDKKGNPILMFKVGDGRYYTSDKSLAEKYSKSKNLPIEEYNLKGKKIFNVDNPKDNEILLEETGNTIRKDDVFFNNLDEKIDDLKQLGYDIVKNRHQDTQGGKLGSDEYFPIDNKQVTKTSESLKTTPENQVIAEVPTENKPVIDGKNTDITAKKDAAKQKIQQGLENALSKAGIIKNITPEQRTTLVKDIKDIIEGITELSSIEIKEFISGYLKSKNISEEDIKTILDEIIPQEKGKSEIQMSKGGLEKQAEEIYGKKASEFTDWVEKNVKEAIDVNEEKTYNEAVKKKDNPTFEKDVNDTIKRVLEENTGTAQDLADLFVYNLKLRNEKFKILEEFNSSDLKKKFQLEQRLNEIDAEQSDLFVAARVLGRQSSAIFRMLQVMGREDYSYGGLRERFLKISKDGKTTPEQEAYIKEITNKLDIANKEIETLKNETLNKESDRVIETLIKEAKTQRKQKNKEVAQVEIDAAKERIKSAIEEAKKTKGNLNDISTVFAEGSKLVYTIAKEYAKIGITEGKLIIKNIQTDLFNAGYEFTEEDIKKALTNFKQETKEKIISNIRKAKSEKDVLEDEMKELTPKEKILLRTIKAKEKELENLEKGITKAVKEKGEKNRYVEFLKDKIQKKKEELGLIPSKSIKETATIIPKERLDQLLKNERTIKAKEKQITDLRKKLTSGDFKKPESKIFEENELLKKKIAEYEDLKDQADLFIEKERLKNLHWSDKTLNVVQDLWGGVQRMLMTGYDLSMILKQNLTAVTRPSNWKIVGQALRQMSKQTFSEKNHKEFMNFLKTTPEYKRAKKLGVKMMGLSMKGQARDEIFSGGIVAGLLEKYVPGIRASSRAYVSFTNVMRLELMNKAIDAFGKNGITPENNQKLFKDIAENINVKTGTANLGKAEHLSGVLNNIFFATRLFTSRFKSLTKPFDPKLSKEARLEYVKDWGNFIGVMGVMYGLAAWGGADIETDPRSSNFLKIKVGKRYLDPLGGYIQIFRSVAQIKTGEKKKQSGEIVKLGGYGTDTKFDVAVSYFVNKLAPTAGFVARYLRETKLYPFEAKKELVKLFVPMNIMQQIEYYTKEKPEMIDALLIGLSTLGVGINYQPEKENKGKAKRGEFSERPERQLKERE